jgi:hypothetical protein
MRAGAVNVFTKPPKKAKNFLGQQSIDLCTFALSAQRSTICNRIFTERTEEGKNVLSKKALRLALESLR